MKYRVLHKTVYDYSEAVSVCHSTAHLQPDGVVEVRPSDLRWQRELKRSSSTILHRLNTLLGTQAVTRLVVK